MYGNLIGSFSSLLNDILSLSKNSPEHLEHVRQVLKRSIQHGPHVKAGKCELSADRTKFRGCSQKMAYQCHRQKYLPYRTGRNQPKYAIFSNFLASQTSTGAISKATLGLLFHLHDFFVSTNASVSTKQLENHFRTSRKPFRTAKCSKIPHYTLKPTNSSDFAVLAILSQYY